MVETRTPVGWALHILVHAILLLGAIIMVLPIIWMFFTSFKPPTEVSLWPPQILPVEWTMENYRGIFIDAPFDRFFLNSVGLSVVATISVCVTSLAAGAMFGKYKFP
ncbi:MAG: carbohydrate ABC transporter permease, partial [Rhodospirillaceae bacterium]|nr:carbohydrate ABC transporter permease [Rhodospirillaceae bacterium]